MGGGRWLSRWWRCNGRRRAHGGACADATANWTAAAHILALALPGQTPIFSNSRRPRAGAPWLFPVATDVTPKCGCVARALAAGFPGVRYASALAATGDNHLLAMALRSANSAARLGPRSFAASRRPVDVQITQPSDGRRVSGSTVITFDAAAPTPLAHVTFLLDTGEIVASTQSALGGIIWNGAGPHHGSRGLTVRVEDSVGDVGEDEIGMRWLRPPHAGRAVRRTRGDRGRDGGCYRTGELGVGWGHRGGLCGAHTGRGCAGQPAGSHTLLIDTSGFTQVATASLWWDRRPGQPGSRQFAGTGGCACRQHKHHTGRRSVSTIVAWFGRNWLSMVAHAAASSCLFCSGWSCAASAHRFTSGVRGRLRTRSAAGAYVHRQSGQCAHAVSPARRNGQGGDTGAFTFLAYGVPLHAHWRARVWPPLARLLYMQGL